MNRTRVLVIRGWETTLAIFEIVSTTSSYFYYFLFCHSSADKKDSLPSFFQFTSLFFPFFFFSLKIIDFASTMPPQNSYTKWNFFVHIFPTCNFWYSSTLTLLNSPHPSTADHLRVSVIPTDFLPLILNVFTLFFLVITAKLTRHLPLYSSREGRKIPEFLENSVKLWSRPRKGSQQRQGGVFQSWLASNISLTNKTSKITKTCLTQYFLILKTAG